MFRRRKHVLTQPYYSSNYKVDRNRSCRMKTMAQSQAVAQIESSGSRWHGSLPYFHFLSLLCLGRSQGWDGPLLSVQVSMTHLVETSISRSVWCVIQGRWNLAQISLASSVDVDSLLCTATVPTFKLVYAESFLSFFSRSLTECSVSGISITWSMKCIFTSTHRPGSEI